VSLSFSARPFCLGGSASIEVASSESLDGGGAFAVLGALDFLRFLFEESFSALDS
jgi:hypothetical protein